MPCPACHGHSLWDDAMNPFWGCNDCGWFGTDQNTSDPRDVWNEEEPAAPDNEQT